MAGRSRGFRRWMLVLAAALSLAPILAIVALQAAHAAPRSQPVAQRMLLRLHDLQIGYAELGGTCERIVAPKGTPARLANFVEDYKPSGCVSLHFRLFGVPIAGEPDPRFVGSAALVARSAAEADAAWSLTPLLLSRINGDELPEEAPATATIGDTTRMFHAPDLISGDGSGTFVVWRFGDRLAVVYASGGSIAANDGAATELARRQQAHLESPTPYTRAEREDADAGLDDPRIELPVYWLGLGFHPGAGLPSSRLLGAGSTYGGREAHGVRLFAEYGRRLALTSWTPAGFSRFLRTDAGRRLRTWPCTTATAIALPQGRARIYAGYAGNPSHCPDRPPSLYRADVYLDGAVVQVDPLAPPNEPVDFGERPGSRPCRSCDPARRPPFDSRRGLIAVARALELRTPRPPRGVPTVAP